MRIAIITGSAFITVQVPRLEPSVRTQAAPIPRAQQGPNPLEGLSRGLQQASNNINQIVKKEVAEQDASRLQKSQSAYETAKAEFLYGTVKKDQAGKDVRVPGLMHTIGEQAVNPEDGITLTEKAKEWHDKYVADQVETMGNERQKQLFQQYADNDTASILSSVGNHEWKQSQVVKLGNAKAATELATETAIKLGTTAGVDPKDYQNSLENMKESVTLQAMIEGYGENSQYGKDLLSTKMSKLHTNIIISKVSSDDDQGAIDYYKEHKAEITDPTNALAIGKTISTLEVRVEGKGEAAQIFEKHMPKDINDPVDLEAMRADVDALPGGTAMKEVAKARVEELSSEYVQNKRLKEEGASNKIHGIAQKDGATYDQVVKAISLESDIDDTTRDNLLNWAESKFKINENKAEKKYAQSIDQLGKLLKFQNEYLAGDYGILTPDQLGTKIGDLGQFTDNAMQFVGTVNDKLDEAKVTDADLKDLIHVLGQNDIYKDLVPNIDKPSSEDKAKMALLQGEVQKIMVQSQKAAGPGKGKSLKTATLQAIQNIRTDTGAFFDDNQPLYLVGTDLADKYSKGGDPNTWSKETQNNYITARWEMLPSNQGKKLMPAELEALRKALLQTEQ